MKVISNLASWVKCYQPVPNASVRLFCFPYAGSGAIAFRSWSGSLSPTIEVSAIEMPGRGTRIKENLLTRIDPIVEAIALALLPKLDKPFVFFGHSMGAILAFECSRLLRKKYGLLPAHLFVSGRHAPQIPPKPSIHTLPTSEFISEVRRFNGIPEAVLENSELMEILLPILRADFEALETYVYSHKSPLECQITAFGGLQDVNTSIDGLKAWANQTRSYFSLQMFTGDHFFINSAQAQLLAMLQKYITAVFR